MMPARSNSRLRRDQDFTLAAWTARLEYGRRSTPHYRKLRAKTHQEYPMWCNGYHGCLSHSKSGFDSRHRNFFFHTFYFSKPFIFSLPILFMLYYLQTTKSKNITIYYIKLYHIIKLFTFGT